MQSTVQVADRCRVCGNDDWLEVISFGDTLLAGDLRDPGEDDATRRFPLEVAVCRDCRLMTLRHVVDPEELFGHYLYMSSDSELITRHSRRIVERAVGGLGLARGDLVVELGSNIGDQLAMFQEEGLRAVGVDPARNLAEIANERGVPTVPAFFTAETAADVAREHGPARMVLGRQCFAHIHDVHDVLDGATTLLAPDGVLAIEVPHLMELLANNQFDTIFHEHLSYFSLHTMSRLFGAHGLRVFDVWTAPVHGGSIVVFATPDGSPRPALPAVAELLAEEQARGLLTDGAYREFAGRVGHVRTEIGGLVRRLAAEGRTVAGYGAPSKGSALLEACGIGRDEVAFCIDTTPLKQGRLLPGSGIPVLSPEQGLARRPDYFLLLAWNYADEIIRKERAYLEDGGRFIVPIPEPRIVSARTPLD